MRNREVGAGFKPRLGRELPRRFLDGLDGFAWSLPAKEVQLFRFKRLGGLEEFFELADCAFGQMPDIQKIAFERGAVGNDEKAVIALFLAAADLFDFQYANGTAR